VLDLVGAKAWELNASVIRSGGRWVLVGLLSGSRVSIDLSVLLGRRVVLIGTVLRTRSLAEKRDLVARFLGGAGPLLRDGTIRPIVDRVVPLARVADAHRALERLEHFGKIVLSIGDAKI
jgi:NADPH:quinone reductase-like Zn-dependent oxidoreductase